MLIPVAQQNIKSLVIGDGVAGAIFSGCAMVITLMLPLSIIFGWDKGPDGKRVTHEHNKYEKQAYISVWHQESLAKLCLLTGGILTYAYVIEHYIAWYSDNPY